MNTGRVLLPLVALGAWSVALADSPFDGTWTVNVEKSHMTPEILVWEDAGHGRWKYTNENLSYTFTPDGTEFTTPTGDAQSWTPEPNGVYLVTTRTHGISRHATFRLSSDTNRLYLQEQGTLPNGKPYQNHETYTRTSPGDGLIGRWKSTSNIEIRPNTLNIQTSANNDVTLSLSLTKSTVRGKWDGKDYPASGPGVPTNTTVALRKTGPDAFEMVARMGARVLEIDRFKLTKDRTAMRESGSNASGRQLFVDVWERQ